jgi:hypothetical protein
MRAVIPRLILSHEPYLEGGKEPDDRDQQNDHNEQGEGTRLSIAAP